MKVGILGGGQLARMLALAGYPLGIHTLCVEPQTGTSASFVTPVIQSDYDDQKQLKKFAEQVDVITFESENIPVATAEFVSQFRPTYPSAQTLAICQDRLNEKNLFQQFCIPAPKFAAINSLADLEKACLAIGLPAVLKTRRFGYDGKGQYLLKTANDLTAAWQKLNEQNLILEEFISFTREVSLLSVRNPAGEIKFYPLVENFHRDGILRLSQAPYENPSLQQLAQEHAKKILELFNYVGVLTIEFFQVGDHLLANEMAPRVHNSGHWTIEGADTSQFENHLRAICNLPLGSTTARGYSAMINGIGTEPDINEILKIPGAHFHTYEKAAKPGRKIGHITLTTNNKNQLEANIELAKLHNSLL